MPAKRPWASTAAAPENPSFGTGSTPWPVRAGGNVRHRGVPGLGQRIADTEERQGIALALAGERRRGEIAGAVEAQQREIVGRVGGDAFGMAKARHDDGAAFLGSPTRRQKIAARADHDRRRVFDCAPHSRQRRGLGVGKALKRAGGRGRDCRHDAFGRLIVEDGDAAHFAAACLRADNEILQPLDA